MKIKKTLFLSAILMLPFCINSHAQKNINAAGGEAYGSGGSASYTIGQVSYQTHNSTDYSIAEGVQQPYEISVVTGIKEDKGIKLSVSAYPNPATDYLQLKIDASSTLSTQSMMYQLFDMNGKLLQSKKITDNYTEINMSNLVPATYFVVVSEENNTIKTFKIVKN